MGNACTSKPSDDEPQVVKAAWDNHFSAFGGKSVEKILLDYNEDSVIAVYNLVGGTQSVYKGIAGAKECFTGLFNSLYDLSDLAAPVQVVKEASGEEPGSVLLVWNCKASGYAEATDTFVFDAEGKILRQNVVVTYTDPKAESAAAGEVATEAPTGKGAVHDAWANHFEAFGGQNVEQILKDYVEESVITVYNQVDGTMTEFKGLSGATDCFKGLFKGLSDLSDLAAPIQHVVESVDKGPGGVFLVWSCGASGFKTATDTFIFNSAGKILRQNVVVHRVGPVQKAWDNHFSAFGGKSVEKVLLDYNEDSVIAVYNLVGGTQSVYKGIAGAKECFTGLFNSLYDLSDLAAPVQVVKEASGEEPGSVFLVWNCKASGYAEATDTFVFDAEGKILRQNVVVTYTDPKAESAAAGEVATEAPTGKGAVHDAWANHFEAFGGQNVEQILKDYVEESVITVYNQVDGTMAEFKGLSGAADCFKGLFEGLSDLSDLAAPIQHVDEVPGNGVFLVWSCGASGFKTATDTFIFNAAGKILRQNVVVHREPKK